LIYSIKIGDLKLTKIAVESKPLHFCCLLIRDNCSWIAFTISARITPTTVHIALVIVIVAHVEMVRVNTIPNVTMMKAV